MSDPVLRQADVTHTRLKQLLAEFETELHNIPPGSPEADMLLADVATLKGHLESPEVQTDILREHLGKTRSSAQALMDSMEGAILKDSPYLAELGRILGMV